MAAAVRGNEHRYVAVNAATRVLLGGNDVLGRPMHEAFPGLVGQQFLSFLDQVKESGEVVHVPEWRFQVDIDNSGTLRELFFDLTLAPVPDENGSVGGVVVHVVDVADRVRQRRETAEAYADTERRYEAAQELVTRLQELLLPRSLPVLPEAEVAAHYLVASRDQSAGGDWFDAVVLPDGRTGLVVGDVVGHGAPASAAMGQLRTVLNRVLLETQSLEEAVAWVDRMAADSNSMRAATMCLAILDPKSGAVRYSTCGHPPPLVLGDDGRARFLAKTGGGPLGVGSPVEIASYTLEPGHVLMLYSDGLVERTGHLLADRIVTLGEVATAAMKNSAFPIGAPTSPSERLAQQCVEIMTRSGYDDDVTVLTCQRRNRPVSPAEIEFPASASRLRSAREFVLQWLIALHLSRREVDLVMLVSTELVANAIEHAYAGAEPGPIRMTIALDHCGVLQLQVTDYGTWTNRANPPSAVRGRGLWMVGALVDELDIRRGVRLDELHDRAPGEAPTVPGTVATARHRLERPAILGLSSPSRYVTRNVEFSIVAEAGPPSGLRVSGPLDITTAARFSNSLDAHSRGGLDNLLVDLCEVNLLASACVQVLFGARARHIAHGTVMTIVTHPHTVCAEVLELVGLGYNRPKAVGAELLEPRHLPCRGHGLPQVG